jgi:lipoprotein-anchoring transpeptidase ErfK/SrfK
MRLATLALVGVLFSTLAAPSGADAARAPALTLTSVNEAQFAPVTKTRNVSPTIVKAQVLLDRAGFSPGVIDGRNGDNFHKALAAFQQENGLEASGKLDKPTWSKLTGISDAPALTEYEITVEDVKGPFLAKIPAKFEAMAKLRHLSYRSPRDELAERFHMDQRLLAALNPGARFDRAGTRIVVADVGSAIVRNDSAVARDDAGDGATTGSATESPTKRAQPPTVARIEIDKAAHELRAFDASGRLLAFYPASIGSREKPAPSGVFKVKYVAYNPVYHYNPKFAFKGVHTRHAFTIKPGPRNPVGSVWIDLSAPSYGIHGTPDPQNVGKTRSHGCVRLTNWDALALAHMVRKGTVVDFVD